MTEHPSPTWDAVLALTEDACATLTVVELYLVQLRVGAADRRRLALALDDLYAVLESLGLTEQTRRAVGS